MLIKGTSKIKGVVEIPSIRQQLKANQVLPINDKDYWNSDMQTALRLGFITVAGEPEHVNREIAPRVITCKNMHIRSIRLPGFTSDISAGAEFALQESQLNDPHVRSAMARGLIKVIELADDNQKPTEGVVKIRKDAAPAPQPTAILKKAAATKKANPATDVNDELPSLSSVIDDPNPPPVKIPSDRAVVFNPTGQNPINVMKGAVVATGDKGAPFVKTNSDKRFGKLGDALRTSEVTPQDEVSEPEINERPRIPVHISDSEYPPPADANEDDPKRNTVIANPFGDPVINTIKGASVWMGPKGTKPKTKKLKEAQANDIVFVDEEQEKERFAKHPKLGKKPMPENIVPDAIDPEEANRKPHPKLDPKRSQDVNFVEINPPKPHPKLDQKENGGQDGSTI